MQYPITRKYRGAGLMLTTTQVTDDTQECLVPDGYNFPELDALLLALENVGWHFTYLHEGLCVLHHCERGDFAVIEFDGDFDLWLADVPIGLLRNLAGDLATEVIEAADG